MANLTAGRRLEIHILVDNATDSLSSVPKHVEPEFAYLHRKGMRVLLRQMHLLRQPRAVLPDNGASGRRPAHTLLFDTGPKPDTFERNTAPARPRSRPGRGTYALARALGSCRRHAPRHRHDPVRRPEPRSCRTTRTPTCSASAAANWPSGGDLADGGPYQASLNSTAHGARVVVRASRRPCSTACFT